MSTMSAMSAMSANSSAALPTTVLVTALHRLNDDSAVAASAADAYADLRYALAADAFTASSMLLPNDTEANTTHAFAMPLHSAGSINLYYAAMEATVAVLAVLGNAAVIAVFCRERRLRKRTNYYIVSLALADLLVGLLGIPFAVLASVGLPRNLYGCLVTLSILVVLCTISIFCLVAVSVDRYWAILYPLAYSRNVRTRTAIRIIFTCWVLGTFIGFLPLLGWHAAQSDYDQACMFVEVMDYDYLVFLFFVTILLPAVVMLIFYVHIYRVIMNQVRSTVTLSSPQATATTKSPPSPSSTSKSSTALRLPATVSLSRHHDGSMLRVLGAARKREVKATQNLSIIVLFFMVCWLPLYTINCIQAFCRDCLLPDWMMLFLILLSHLNSAVNPLLYAYHLKDFRASLKSLLCGMCGVKVAGPAPSAALQNGGGDARYSLHGVGGVQSRLAGRLMERRPTQASMRGPRIYIDSPIYLRQRADPAAHNGTSFLAIRAADPPHVYIGNYDALDTAPSVANSGGESSASTLFDVSTAAAQMRLAVGNDCTPDNRDGRSVTFNGTVFDAGVVRTMDVPLAAAVAVGRPIEDYPHILRLETQALIEHERRAASLAVVRPKTTAATAEANQKQSPIRKASMYRRCSSTIDIQAVRPEFNRSKSALHCGQSDAPNSFS